LRLYFSCKSIELDGRCVWQSWMFLPATCFEHILHDHPS